MAELRRFYTERTNLRVGSSVKLPDEEAQHIRGSLRLGKNDYVRLFNGESEYVARLTVVSKDVVMAEITEAYFSESPGEKIRTKITLFQSLIRIPHFELVLQKATELGVDRIVPLDAEFSQIKLNNIDKKFIRWEKIILEACKQSERHTIPELLPIAKFNEVIEKFNFYDIDLPLFFTTPRASVTKISELTSLKSTADEIISSRSIGVFIGPEGGFSPLEHQAAAEANIKFVATSDMILRAETAGITSVALVDYLANQN